MEDFDFQEGEMYTEWTNFVVLYAITKEIEQSV